MKIYRLTHNILYILKNDRFEESRYFAKLEYANSVFEMLLERIDYSNDEWISLDEVIVEEDCFGEYKSTQEHILRYFSDDTMIGVKFNPEDYE